MIRRFGPWLATLVAAVASFGLVVSRVGTPALVEGSSRLWMLMGLAWVVALLLGFGLIRCVEALYAEEITPMPWYKSGGLVALSTALVGAGMVGLAFSWSSSQVGQLSYARARPGETMLEDMARVVAVLKSDCENRRSTPETMTELVKLIKEYEVPLHYTWIEDRSWVDPWGRPFYYGREPGPTGLSCVLVVYSFGENGLDEFGSGDDIALPPSQLDSTGL